MGVYRLDGTLMKIDPEQFKKVKEDAKKYYSGVHKVHCPYLKEDIHFNNEGFEHLLTTSWNRGRSTADQYTRLRLLPKAVEVIQYSHLLQEYNKTGLFVRQKINSRWEKRLKDVQYYVFIAVFIKSGLRLKVVVKRIEGASPYFWTVYPSWRVTTGFDGSKRKAFYSGNLEED